jgi:putative NIF3 family GTP cyclohydrolase 1 type 2
VGHLQPMEQLGALARRLARACGADVPMMVGNASDKVRRVAVVSGSPGNMLRDISSSVADVVVTGEVSYHLAAEARQRGQRLILLGHAASEKVFARHLAPLLLNHLEVIESGIQVHVFEDFTDPYTAIKSTTTPRKRRKAS